MPSLSKRKRFENLTPTPQFIQGTGILDLLKAQFSKPRDLKPLRRLPVINTDLKRHRSEMPSVIWFGHSSYLIHAGGLNFLIDPVLCGYASPVRFMIQAFEGTDCYKPHDFPEIDYLILTHNHYDHLDLKSMKALSKKIKNFIIPEGASEDLKGLKIENKTQELSWNGTRMLSETISITATPARHYSGRGLIKNTSHWCSYVLNMNGYKIFIGGDSGYDKHFKLIGDEYGPFDLAILECGQYDDMWPLVHSKPEELIQEAKDLRANLILPVHWGKFALANHSWSEPIERFVKSATEANIKFTTPMIGEPVYTDRELPLKKWWKIY